MSRGDAVSVEETGLGLNQRCPMWGLGTNVVLQEKGLGSTGLNTVNYNLNYIFVWDTLHMSSLAEVIQDISVLTIFTLKYLEMYFYTTLRCRISSYPLQLPLKQHNTKRDEGSSNTRLHNNNDRDGWLELHCHK